MVEKLFYKDAYLRKFTGKVIACQKLNRGYAVVLDKTAFYPEGGGQPGDIGVIGAAKVLDTHEKAGEVQHYTDVPLEPGTIVEGEVDWKRRFDLMQQHSGEHIISGLVHEKYGFENIGFHMGSDIITIDFSGVLTLEQLRAIELTANQKIWENSQVEIEFYNNESLKNLPYRSKKPIEGDVRIVHFAGADTCACCGTHVARTGEIGCIRILSVQRLREGVRVEMLSGARCLNYFDMAANENHNISVAMSAKECETSCAVNRLKEENQQLKNRIAQLEISRFDAIALEHSGLQDALVFEPGLSPDSVRRLCSAVMQTNSGCCAVFSGDDESGYKYAVGKENGNLHEFIKKMNVALKGRGGGKAFFVQGTVAASESEIRRFFSIKN